MREHAQDKRTAMKYQTISQFIEQLHSSPEGLSNCEAERRLREFGPNILHEEKRKPQIVRFLAGFTHFFAIILWFGAAIAFFAEFKDPGGGMGLLGVAIVGVIVVNAIFSFWQEHKAEQAIEELKKLIPHTVKVVRDGTICQLASAGLVPGDLVLLEEGDDVPADCRLIEAFGLRADYASLTGESVPVSRTAGTAAGEAPMHDKNLLLAGTSIFSGQGKAIVYATGMNTEFGKIAHLTQSAKRSLSPLQLEIIRLSRVIAAIAISVGLIFFLVGKAMGISFWANTIFALGIIVALVPEGLLPEVTLALATCSQRMAKRKAIVRHLPSVETLGCATVICTDKTGTLTENKMWVSELFFCDRTLRSDSITDAPAYLQKPLGELSAAIYHCENVKESVKDGKRVLLGDPMENALLEFARACFRAYPHLSSGVEDYRQRLAEIPFDTERKRLSVIHKDELSGHEILFCKGALELLLPLCCQIREDAAETNLDDKRRGKILQVQEDMAGRGLRVIAVCKRLLPNSYSIESAETELTFLGLVGLQDPPRKEVPEAIRKCKNAGIRVIMITGDHPNTAMAIAKQIDLVDSIPTQIITGTELRKISDTQLQIILGRRQVIFARTDADQKMRIVQTLKRSGHIVAVTGDGVNDAPALKAADIGIAMGMSGTDVAREAAVMILADDNFSSIVSAIEEGRAVFANIRKFLTYVLASNIAELVPCLAFVLFKIPLPLTVMQILSIDLGTDLLPALALGAETPDPAIMTIAPRSTRKGLFDLRLLARAYLYLGMMIATGSMFAYLAVLQTCGWHPGQNLAQDSQTYRLATTACLMGIMCMQIINSSNCRSDTKSIFKLGVFSNKLLNIGVLTELILMLLITYSEPGNAIFHTAALPGWYWLFMLPFMLGMLLIEELRKLISNAFTFAGFKTRIRPENLVPEDEHALTR
jgi:sodium/potassium-transporting ATPase subunit alpha